VTQANTKGLQNMVDIVKQLCIKSYSITAQNGDSWEAKQGKEYTTSPPCGDKDTVTVFSTYWVPVPKEHFVLVEE
jgi:hypothetical protein